MKTIALLITLIISTSSLAQNAVLLDKGDIAPFKGTLINNDRVDKLVKAEKSNIVLRDLQLAQEELTEYHKADAKSSRKKLSEAKYDSYINVLGAFVVGVLVTGFAFKVNQEIGEL